MTESMPHFDQHAFNCQSEVQRRRAYRIKASAFRGRSCT